MEDDKLGFVIVCAFAVVCFFAIVLLPITVLVLALVNRRKAEVSESSPECTHDQVEAARRRLVEKGVVPEDRWC